MKIALVCHHYSEKKGGLEKYTIFLARTLARLGHEVHVLARAWTSEPDIIFHRVPMIRLSSPLKNLSFAWQAERLLLKENFDVIHSMERILRQDVFRVSDGVNPVQMAQQYANPTVRRLKAMGPRRLTLQYLENQIFLKNGARRIMTNSRLVRDQVIRHYGVRPDRISVIYNSVDGARFHPGVRERFREETRNRFGVREADLLLLFISNNFKLKNLDGVIRAMALSGADNLKLMAIGTDNPRPYQQAALKQGLADRVLFLGPQKEIERFFGAADVFIMPSRYDAFANVCLEAMACGLPTITSRTNGSSEPIQSGQNGIVLNGLEAAEMADAVNALRSSTEQGRMGRAAARTAREFTPEKHMAQVLRLYEEIRTEKEIRP